MQTTDYVDPIDVVYTWVDASDENLTSLIRKYSGSKINEAQYRDWKELKYSLRSIRKHMPWVRNIFIVTNGQKPKYIQSNGTNVSFVRHDQIFPDPEMLPVFNSLAIECNLHRIPGLAEHFVYFNDDMIVGRELLQDDFFLCSEQERFLFEHRNLKNDPNTTDDYGRLLNFNHHVLAERYGDLPRLSLAHTPQPYLKSECATVWEVWKDLFLQTSAERFRRPTSAYFRILYTYYRIYQSFGAKSISEIARESRGRLEMASANNALWIPLGDEKYHYRKLLEELPKNPPKFFCLQDHVWKDHDEVRRILETAMEQMYPEPAPFEAAETNPGN